LTGGGKCLQEKDGGSESNEINNWRYLFNSKLLKNTWQKNATVLRTTAPFFEEEKKTRKMEENGKREKGKGEDI